MKRSSAQPTEHSTVESEAGRQVLVVVNFPPKQIADFITEMPVPGVPDGAGESCWFSPSARCRSAGVSTDAHGVHGSPGVRSCHPVERLKGRQKGLVRLVRTWSSQLSAMSR
jgi:hypothetical protein